MKKITLTFLTLTVISSFANCKENKSSALPGGSAEKKASDNVYKDTNTANKKTLIVYFSMPETTNPENMTKDEKNSVVVINGKVLGNTQYVASVIQKKTGSDLFRIEPKTPYPTNHKILVDIAKKEKIDNKRPELKNYIKNIDQYETVFLGYPIWWGDFPMIMYSFLEKHNLSGKKVILFCTHGGSELAGTVEIVKRLKPDAHVIENAFVVSRDDVENSEQDIILWLKELGY